MSKIMYQEHGYALLRSQVPHDLIDTLMENFSALVAQLSGVRIKDPCGAEMADFLNKERYIQSLVYEEIRKPEWLELLSKDLSITAPVKDLLGARTSLFSKIIFRTDAPLETSEIAVWHQDYHYVRGNTDIITAWVPMRDTSFEHGCLMVMPGSHKDGPLKHDNLVLQKRHFPSGIFDREVRYVEMKKGDLLLFHSCLLHSSGVNVSNVCRFSVQARYTRTEEPVDPAMGQLIPV